jgi:acyl carrier protein
LLETDSRAIEHALRTHVLTKYAVGVPEDAFGSRDDLLASGVVDSMGVIEVVSFLEETFEITVDDFDIVPSNFRSVRAMTEYVASKKGIDLRGPFVEDFRSFVTATVPHGSIVLVVSHGDDALLDLEGSTAWHFPRDDSGGYAGYNPADGSAAVQQVEAQRRLGATHIAFPEPELWWLEYYTQLRDHLANCEEVARDDAGVVYALVPTASRTAG